MANAFRKQLRRSKRSRIHHLHRRESKEQEKGDPATFIVASCWNGWVCSRHVRYFCECKNSNVGDHLVPAIVHHEDESTEVGGGILRVSSDAQRFRGKLQHDTTYTLQPIGPIVASPNPYSRRLRCSLGRKVYSTIANSPQRDTQVALAYLAVQNFRGN